MSARLEGWLLITLGLSIAGAAVGALAGMVFRSIDGPRKHRDRKA